MGQSRLFTAVISPAARIINRFRYKRPFVEPQKAIILQAGTAADVMLATPMAALLTRKFPHMRLDWAVHQAAYSLLLGNQTVTKPRLLPTFPRTTEIDELRLISELEKEGYDTCFIPDYYPQLTQAALRAQIPQRVGLWHSGRGYNLTNPIQVPYAVRHRASLNLALAELDSSAIQLSRAPMVFFPSDIDRKAVSERLIDELNWMGERPLLLLNPGAGDEPDEQRWPIERYVLLGNRILRRHDVQLVAVGTQADQKVTQEVTGMIAGHVPNWTGKLSFGQLGALAELANLYVGNNCGSTHVATAIGCPTVAIFGPTDPSVSAPYATDEEQVQVLWRQAEGKRPFHWDDGVTVAEAETAVHKMLNI